MVRSARPRHFDPTQPRHFDAANWSADMKNTMLMCLAVVMAACGGDPKYEQTLKNLEGTWLAPCVANPPDMNGQVSYARPKFSYAANTSGAFEYALFGDAACTYPLATFLLESNITLGKELPAVGSGVYELDVKYKKITATPFVDGFVMAFGQAQCGNAAWQTGVGQDISATGCFNFKPLAACPADYDVARVEGAQFFNGARDADMCVPAGRPTRLSTTVFDRAP